jgi:hypothetical protein
MIDFLVKLALPPIHNHIQFHPYLILKKNKQKKKKPKYKILIYLNEIQPKQFNLMLLSMYQSFTHTYKTNKRRKYLKINKILIYLNEIHHKQLDFPIAYDKIE